MTILIVDSDGSLVKRITKVLGACGHETLSARQGVEAIRVYERHAKPVELVLAALNLPGLTGFELADSLTQWNRELRLIFMSEHRREFLFGDGSRRGGHFLQKPFTDDQLLAAITAAASSLTEDASHAAASAPIESQSPEIPQS